MSKGKMLSTEELLKMDGQYVYIEPFDEIFKEDEGKAKINISKSINMINFIAHNDEIWRIHILKDNSDSSINKNNWLNVYEWIDDDKEDIIENKENKEDELYQESKQLEGWQVLKMISENKIENETNFELFYNGAKQIETNVYFKDGKFYDCGKEISVSDLILFTFTIKEPEYIKFDEARRTGKRFKHKTWDNYYVLKDALIILNCSSAYDINKMLDEKAWLVEE